MLRAEGRCFLRFEVYLDPPPPPLVPSERPCTPQMWGILEFLVNGVTWGPETPIPLKEYSLKHTRVPYMV